MSGTWGEWRFATSKLDVLQLSKINKRASPPTFHDHSRRAFFHTEMHSTILRVTCRLRRS